MIGKIIKGRGFRGLAEYLLRGGRGEIVAGPMAGRTPRELAAEFGRLRQLNPKLGKAVAHFSLSASPDDAPLSQDAWQSIAERFMGEMGFADAPWCAVVHHDTDHQHVHVMACRIDVNGKTVSDASDFRRAETAIRRIEADFGLIAVASPRRGGDRPEPPASTPQGTLSMPVPFQPFGQLPPPGRVPPARDTSAPSEERDAPDSEAAGASCADALVPRKRRDMRRIVADDTYGEMVSAVFGDELTRVFKHPGGAVLYFKGPGRITDTGDKLTVFGPMPEREAARRIVALAISPERGWKSITFTGSSSFVELAMREALRHQLAVNPVGEAQAQILAKLMAERRGGLGAMAGPKAGGDPLTSMLSELDELPLQPAPGLRPRQSTAPATRAEPEASPPAEPVVGVRPLFLNLGERLRDRRALRARSDSSEQESGPGKSKPSNP